MNLDQYIGELLYRYDCVIVPGLGGFIANYKPARINSTTHTFSPPSKSLSFNLNLILNDGLLANHIALDRSISYKDANTKIDEAVKGIFQKLKDGKRVVLKDIGTLQYDTQKRMLFEPATRINYLPEAFGLDRFRLAPVVTPIVEMAGSPGFRINWRKAAAVLAIPILAGSFAYFLWKGTTQQNSFQFSHFGFEKASSLYQPRIEIDVQTLDFQSIDADFNELSERMLVHQFREEIQEPKFFVIGGCFSQKANAIRFKKKLGKKGYPAIALPNYKSMWAVAYQGFQTEEKARVFLQEIKQNENNSAWLLRNSG
jgi:nucleoid DNA-binding protein